MSMSYKWRTSKGLHEDKIVKVEVIRETEKMLVIREERFGISGNHAKPEMLERKAMKATEWEVYHDSWKDAHDHVVKRAQLRLEAARRSLQLAQSHLGNVKGMRNPDEVEGMCNPDDDL